MAINCEKVNEIKKKWQLKFKKFKCFKLLKIKLKDVGSY